MGIFEQINHQNLLASIDALQKSEQELLEEDPTHEPLGDERKAELLAQLRADYDDLRQAS